MGTVVVLAVCFAVRGIVRHYQLVWLPEAGATILVGMIAGFLLKVTDLQKLHFSEDLFLRLLLPPILLEATLAIDKPSFRRLVGPILLFAFVGKNTRITSSTCACTHNTSRNHYLDIWCWIPCALWLTGNVRDYASSD